MVVVEALENGLIHTYTTEPETKRLRQVDTGFIYEDAIDVVDSGHTYVEVDKPAGNN